jgi:hypothetical protein
MWCVAQLTDTSGGTCDDYRVKLIIEVPLKMISLKLDVHAWVSSGEVNWIAPEGFMETQEPVLDSFWTVVDI